ncbi:MAG: serine/threonine protein kinase, partial [Fuerstia sp.]|nr:serine/threonine protein kinase [Fuerstiella sp.]
MTPNNRIQDDDLRLLTAISDKFEQAITAGETTSIETVLAEAPVRLRDHLLSKVLSIQLNHDQRSGRMPRVEEYLAKFPDRQAAVLLVFRKATAAADTIDGFEETPASNPHDANTNTIIGSNEELFAAETLLNATSESTPCADLILDAVFPVYPDGKGYIVEQEIDRGGMGVVLKVRDEHLGRTLALKVIRGQERGSRSHATVNDEMSARFIREAQVTGRLDHPGVVPIHELATDKDGRMYFTMKYVQGQTLSKVIPELRVASSLWSLNRVLEVLIRVCETLAFAHSKGVIHRDLKPANIMVGEFGEAYVMDWGLAKIIGESEPTAPQSAVPETPVLPRAVQVSKSKHSTTNSQSQTHSHTMYGDVVGTAYYMPPEQA